jgi:hypothetical protein
MRTLWLTAILLAASLSTLLAQEENKNISIKEATDEYRFVKGDKTNPVKIKQEMKTVYYCNDYRTSLTVAEFYNDKIEINDVDIRVNGDKVKNFKPNDEYYSMDGIFFSDARVNYFSLPLEKKGTTSTVKYEKTYLDPRYFTSIYFSEPYLVENKEVKLVVPAWMKLEIKEYNCKGGAVVAQKENKGDETIYTYTIKNLPASIKEENAPGPTYIEPHILIMCKYAEPEGTKITYFNTLADQYKWYRSLVKEVGNDATTIKAKAEEITKGVTDDFQKVKLIFQWVQDNVRYIAYEDGIAGFKPDKAQEVLRKKYGDCKGMGNLMAEMLKAIKLDGRVCWLGTNHIAYDYSTPSLGVDNHVISAWLYKGKTYYLDATEKFIGFGETAERIQGRQVLIEDGDKYLLQTIPVVAEAQNTAFEKRVLKINGNNLEGKVTQTWKGESKEWLLSQFHDIKKEQQTNALTRFLNEGKSNFIISNLKIINLEDYNKDIQLEYDVVIKDAAVSFDKETYIDIDDRKDFINHKFEVDKRKLAFDFPYKGHMVYEVELQLPAGTKQASAINTLKIDKPEYSFLGEYKAEANKIVYKREVRLKKTRFAKPLMETWNKDLQQLADFYNNQLTLTK